MKNLTPHVIKIRIEKDGQEHEVVFEPDPSGPVRVTELAQYFETYRGIRTVKKEYCIVENFNRKGEEDVIVSAVVAEALKKEFVPMEGVFTPDTGPDSAVRDEEGRIVAVRRLIRHTLYLPPFELKDEFPQT